MGHSHGVCCTKAAECTCRLGDFEDHDVSRSVVHSYVETGGADGHSESSTSPRIAEESSRHSAPRSGASSFARVTSTASWIIEQEAPASERGREFEPSDDIRATLDHVASCWTEEDLKFLEIPPGPCIGLSRPLTIHRTNLSCQPILTQDRLCGNELRDPLSACNEDAPSVPISPRFPTHRSWRQPALKREVHVPRLELGHVERITGMQGANKKKVLGLACPPSDSVCIPNAVPGVRQSSFSCGGSECSSSLFSSEDTFRLATFREIASPFDTPLPDHVEDSIERFFDSMSHREAMSLNSAFDRGEIPDLLSIALPALETSMPPAGGSNLPTQNNRCRKLDRRIPKLQLPLPEQELFVQGWPQVRDEDAASDHTKPRRAG